ncbi:MAG: hypothetical protein ABSA76_10985, partial [Bacteroidales bacterium]
LIKSLADYVYSHGTEIKKMLREADVETVNRGLNPTVKDSFAIEFKVRPLPENVTIKTFEAEPSAEPNVYPPFKKTDKQVTVNVPYFIDYYPVKNVRFPFAWLIEINDKQVLDLLRLHGIKIEKLTEPLKCSAERFEISDLKGAPNLNQGHYLNTIQGRYISDAVDFPAGTIVIRAAQPLANLAAYLLEPQSNDGLLTWNYLDRYLIPQWGRGYNPYPVCRIIIPVEIKSTPLK